MQNIFLILSSILAFISYLVYIIAIFKKEAKPHRTTRFVLFIITALATASLFAQKNQVAIWLTGIFAFNSFIIFILSLKYGMGGWEKTDIVCLIIALIGIGLWKFTKSPSLALYASIAADFTGVVPTLIKTYHFPKTEVWTFFAIDAVAALFNLMAIKNWALVEFAYPLYIIFTDFTIVLLILRPQPDKK